ncbi:acyl-CoA thioester hydrolase/BAAT C-terminal domain-containing protein [Ruminococcus sp. 5_1_39BFAA]|uniref:acyl-CoA thioester hydrolase/BAAT C-terminal domain-containing protein n=1 Tax=Ruminococcus sp. 5_1_39BFAA TaxID=457412 RepID=UPI0035621CA5
MKVENIKGKLVLVGAEDDVLWDNCKYIRRITEQLQSMPHGCKYKAMIYEHGTHFVFPESMLHIMIPVGSGLLVRLAFRAGRKYPRECKAARMDIDRRLSKIIRMW